MHKANSYLFAYGTLLIEKVQIETFGRVLISAPDKLIGYRLEYIEITDPEVLSRSGLSLHPIAVKSDNANDFITGKVFMVNEQELLKADSYEVSEYKRIEVLLDSGILAWVYVQ